MSGRIFLSERTSQLRGLSTGRLLTETPLPQHGGRRNRSARSFLPLTLQATQTLLFRPLGYEATGINRGSIYGTFGDKKGLFLAVLPHYAEEVAKPMMAELSDPDPRRALNRMFDSIIRRTSDPRFPRGCLNTNTLLECPASGDEITRKIAEGFGRQESAIHGVLRRAQVRGRLDSSLDVRALARFFMAVAQGLNVVNKAVPDPGILTDVSRVAMTVLDAVSGPQRDRRIQKSLRE
jgi:TetR/AcrR family transcriptional regulator, transcriptional repressor for nem operon